jgi:hypothetical protein
MRYRTGVAMRRSNIAGRRVTAFVSWAVGPSRRRIRQRSQCRISIDRTVPHAAVLGRDLLQRLTRQGNDRRRHSEQTALEVDVTPSTKSIEFGAAEAARRSYEVARAIPGRLLRSAPSVNVLVTTLVTGIVPSVGWMSCRYTRS